MKLQELIEKLQDLRDELGEDAQVEVVELEDGPNSSSRYGIGMGLKVGETFIEELQLKVDTGCLY